MLVSFICTGNICRSPSAAIIARARLAAAGLTSVQVISAGTHAYHVGDGIDPRAGSELASRGYQVVHTARALDNTDLDADLILVATRSHQQQVLARGADPERVRLLRWYDPTADSLELDDPYYGAASGFQVMVDQIESALDGLVSALEQQVRGEDAASGDGQE